MHISTLPTLLLAASAIALPAKNPSLQPRTPPSTDLIIRGVSLPPPLPFPSHHPPPHIHTYHRFPFPFPFPPAKPLKSGTPPPPTATGSTRTPLAKWAPPKTPGATAATTTPTPSAAPSPLTRRSSCTVRAVVITAARCFIPSVAWALAAIRRLGLGRRFRA